MRTTNRKQGSTNIKGFTLVELVIVIAVIAILAGVLIPTFSNVLQKANDSKDLQDAINIYKEQALALKANNELTDTNHNNKEEVLVVLREGQADVKYYLFVDGKAEVKESLPQANEYDVKISGGANSSGEEVKVYTLTKVTDVSQLYDGAKVVIAAKNGNNWYVGGVNSGNKINSSIFGDSDYPTVNIDTNTYTLIKNDENTWVIYTLIEEKTKYLRTYTTESKKSDLNFSNDEVKNDQDKYNGVYTWEINFNDEGKLNMRNSAFKDEGRYVKLSLEKNYFGNFSQSSNYSLPYLYIVNESNGTITN